MPGGKTPLCHRRHTHSLRVRLLGVYWPAALARCTSRTTQAGSAATITTGRALASGPVPYTTTLTGCPPALHPTPHMRPSIAPPTALRPSPAPRRAASMTGPTSLLSFSTATVNATALTPPRAAANNECEAPPAARVPPTSDTAAAPAAAVPRRGSTLRYPGRRSVAAAAAAAELEPQRPRQPRSAGDGGGAVASGVNVDPDGNALEGRAPGGHSGNHHHRRGRRQRRRHQGPVSSGSGAADVGEGGGKRAGGGGGGDGGGVEEDTLLEGAEAAAAAVVAGDNSGMGRGRGGGEDSSPRARLFLGDRARRSSSTNRGLSGTHKATTTPRTTADGGDGGGGGSSPAGASPKAGGGGGRPTGGGGERGRSGPRDADTVYSTVTGGTATGGGTPVSVQARGGGRGGEGFSLADRIRACGSLDELVALYDVTQQQAEEQARRAALEAGAAAAAAGLAAGAAGLPAGTVWMFLAAAGELVAGWRQHVPAGYRRARLREEKGMRTQLSRLLGEACGVVLWAERLPPEKLCLLLSLMVVSGARHPRAGQHLGVLVEDSLNSLEQYSSGQVALVASSFARLGYFPGRGWLETLLEATSGRLSSWRPVDLGFLLWAMAKWKAKPPATWLEEYYQAFECCSEKARESELAMVCWAIGVGAVRGGPRPPESFTNRLMLEVQVRLPSMGSQGLAHVAWGLCCCDVKPPRFWLRDFTEAAKATLPYASNGLAFSNLLWALAHWQQELHPGESWLGEACKHSARWLHTLDARSLAVMLLALSDLGHTPPVEWVGLALETAHRKLATTDPPSAVAVLWAVSRFERQRAATAAAAAAATEAAAAAGDATAAAAVRLPPRRRRLASLSPEELMLVADDIGFGFGFGPDGKLGGVSAATPLALRPPRKWLVRYSPLLKDFAMAAAGLVSPAPVGRNARGSPTVAPAAADTSSPALTGSRFAFAGLDTNQMLDLAVALADLYVYPGDNWMSAHEARMALSGGAVTPGFAGPSGGGSRGRGDAVAGSGGGGGLTSYQWQLLMAAYAALDETEEEYAAPRAGETY